MSTATDLAEIDAAIAEAELTEDEAARVREAAKEGEPIQFLVAGALAERAGRAGFSDEQAPAPPPLTEPTEQMWRDLQRENDRHGKAVHRIMGPFVDGFETCDECDGVGLRPPGPTMKTHDLFIPCETCSAFGHVLTGSRDPNHATRPCPTCKSRGYLELLDSSGSPLAPDAVGSAPAVPSPPSWTDDAIPATNGAASGEPVYGTPSWMGDPNIGH